MGGGDFLVRWMGQELVRPASMDSHSVLKRSLRKDPGCGKETGMTGNERRRVEATSRVCSLPGLEVTASQKISGSVRILVGFGSSTLKKKISAR